MTTLKFKTSINCNGCVAKVSPFLDNTKGIDKWEVELTNPQKILTIETSSLKEEDIIDGLKNLGYRAEKID
ncbi:MAG: heavy-metal-associated domain-containing protein [Bacteroidota bacterium]|nr:heavy-metal-associated domain-containing protein [Bacteroidota bacterium]